MQGTNQGRNDWLTKASPDEIVNEATAIFGKLGTLDQTYQDKFVRSVQNTPPASDLIERFSRVTG